MQPSLATTSESLAAAEWAAHEAVRRDRPLRLVHAWNWHPRQESGEQANAAQRYLGRRSLRQAEERVRRTCPDVRLNDEQAQAPSRPRSLLPQHECARLPGGDGHGPVREDRTDR
ncbi:universal stress protein [Streptomyces sasae]|uniref:universal stress protein n=1 Tax=Streptomyces sasae TaxID=1266772 RepID=UPI0037444616